MEEALAGRVVAAVDGATSEAEEKRVGEAGVEGNDEAASDEAGAESVSGAVVHGSGGGIDDGDDANDEDEPIWGHFYTLYWQQTRKS